MTPAQKAARTKKAKEISRGGGRVCVYVRHCTGYYGDLRPSYDSAVDCRGDLTDRQVSQLRAMIARYIRKCEEANKKPFLNDGRL